MFRIELHDNLDDDTPPIAIVTLPTIPKKGEVVVHGGVNYTVIMVLVPGPDDDESVQGRIAAIVEWPR